MFLFTYREGGVKQESVGLTSQVQCPVLFLIPEILHFLFA